jgi:hypothetical protein
VSAAAKNGKQTDVKAHSTRLLRCEAEVAGCGRILVSLSDQQAAISAQIELLTKRVAEEKKGGTGQFRGESTIAERKVIGVSDDGFPTRDYPPIGVVYIVTHIHFDDGYIEAVPKCTPIDKVTCWQLQRSSVVRIFVVFHLVALLAICRCSRPSIKSGTSSSHRGTTILSWLLSRCPSLLTQKTIAVYLQNYVIDIKIRHSPIRRRSVPGNRRLTCSLTMTRPSQTAASHDKEHLMMSRSRVQHMHAARNREVFKKKEACSQWKQPLMLVRF